MTQAIAIRRTRRRLQLQPSPAEWVRLRPGLRVLVVGASGAIGGAVVRVLAANRATIGAHSYRHGDTLRRLVKTEALADARIMLYPAELSTQRTCHALVDRFVRWAGGIDGLVQLSGDVRRPCRWEELTEAEWLADLNVNLSGPFFLVQRAMQAMRSAGGTIILTSTASARHGGGTHSMAYGVAKAGIECLTKGLARDGAPHGIRVNAVAPGFIDTPFHRVRMQRNLEDLARRAALVPLGRAGTPEEVAGLIAYLLSPGADYMTGECIAISGGDWL